MNRILIIEDQPDIRRLICMTLEGSMHLLREASDGVSGLAEARRWQPDLVLLDVMLPGDADGLQVCREIRQEVSLAHTKVLLLSARGRPVDRDAGLAAGADAYLSKPFSPLELQENVDRLLQSA